MPRISKPEEKVSEIFNAPKTVIETEDDDNDTETIEQIKPDATDHHQVQQTILLRLIQKIELRIKSKPSKLVQ